ncbi:MAG TPA: methyltransferase domain-containing protein [Thermoanaerobaculia bacterium]|jgi:SAM-dependent methyltransferase|nr:methyltransferase domain-containing protein [Thermoanaerobaculia bacterium]
MNVQHDRRWEAFAEREPYFAVFTDPKFLSANRTPNQEREFFDSGEVLVDAIFHTIKRRLEPDFTPESILEFGCGPGRLAIPFARRAGSVTAVDRSPAMLDAARREAAKQSIANVYFKTTAEFAATQRTFDLVNAYLLFQRLPPTQGLSLLRELLGRIGSGGIGAFHFLHRTSASPFVAWTRAARERVPALNGVANLMRGKEFDEPFIPSHAYDLDDVFRILIDAGFETSHVVFEHNEDMSSAIVFVQAPLSFSTIVDHESDPAASETPAGALIDVRELIARTSIDDLNRTAEEYFASLKEWEHHLAKPFSKADETPPILMNVATLLQGLRLTPGMTVLEFGAGTGWLSRYLTQLGCRMILLDVSPTALRIAAELFDRQPPVGERPAPQFLPFDGRRIDLPDGSVERIVSFDAFHHAPNPDDVLREFGRVLKPGGIAAFAEPGPRHSRTPLSQFEMRTYGVVENDVDIHAIWRTAQTCGFRDLKLVVFHGPAFHVSLDDYEDLLAGGATSVKWAASTRVFLRDVRSFFLFKEGSERVDSRSGAGLACDIAATLVSSPAIEAQPIVVDATVTNRGAAIWLPADAPFGGVALGAHLYEEGGKLITFDLHWERLTNPLREISSGETVRVRMTLPSQVAGRYLIEVDCVSSGVSWFAQLGSQPARLAVEVIPGDV